MSEFDLIRRHFNRPTPNALLGIGDDAALLQVSAGNVLAISTDMLVSGTHFFPDADPFLLGHKTLAVNLSDLAAMGAVPRWATLAIALPQADDVWLERFSAGFFALAQQHGVDLIGGDTTRGPLNLCVSIIGEVPPQLALRRDGAREGDDIWVSGKLGDAALGLAHLQEKIVLPQAALAACLAALHAPVPRVALGLALRGIARSAIDISDGLLADLGHILVRSQVAARIVFDDLPLSKTLRDSGQSKLALSGGDDYELCFTAAVENRVNIEHIAAELQLPLTRIGTIVAGTGCVVHDVNGHTINIEGNGYDHFN
ncbi:MAG: thiamine-phosphate kinase [Gallionella sp.]|nr:thiamine-phosphate kinase [Gallionella sp.]